VQNIDAPECRDRERHGIARLLWVRNVKLNCRRLQAALLQPFCLDLSLIRIEVGENPARP